MKLFPHQLNNIARARSCVKMALQGLKDPTSDVDILRFSQDAHKILDDFCKHFLKEGEKLRKGQL